MNNSGFNCWCYGEDQNNNCGCKNNSHKFYCECEKQESGCGCHKQTSECGYSKSNNSKGCGCGNNNSTSYSNYTGYNYSNTGCNQSGYGWY